MAVVLVIDDDINFCDTMESLILRMEHTCLKAHSLNQGIELLRQEDIDILLLDVILPDGNGLTYLPEIKEKSLSDPEIFIVTGIGDPDGAETAIRSGVWDYILKPTSIKQTKLSLTRALKYRKEKKKKHQTIHLDLSKIVGESFALRHCFEKLAGSVASNAAVLVTGETGTGKELFANTIHDNSSRKHRRFVPIDCASLTESLLESTLFGHKKGAFTGAGNEKTGLVKLADQGTLFLDEVGEMPLSTQKSFLRILQEKKFRPIGSIEEISSDFRIISATNKDLDEMVKKGQFRQDLLYRLCTMKIKIPPLRERGKDIKLLSLYHINRLCEEYKIPNKGFEQGFFDVLSAYDWPGNVREMFNALETAFVNSGLEKILYPMHLPGNIRINVTKALISSDQNINFTSEETFGKVEFNQQDFSDSTVQAFHFSDPLPDFKEFKNRMEKAYLVKLIKQKNKKLKEILNHSGLSKSHFYTLIKKYDINDSN